EDELRLIALEGERRDLAARLGAGQRATSLAGAPQIGAPSEDEQATLARLDREIAALRARIPSRQASAPCRPRSVPPPEPGRRAPVGWRSARGRRLSYASPHGTGGRVALPPTRHPGAAPRARARRTGAPYVRRVDLWRSPRTPARPGRSCPDGSTA